MPYSSIPKFFAIIGVTKIARIIFNNVSKELLKNNRNDLWVKVFFKKMLIRNSSINRINHCN